MEHTNHLKKAQVLTKLLDSQFKIGKYRVGLDPLLGLIPGIGDLFSFLLSAYIVWIAVQAKIPGYKLAQMFSHIFYDFLLGFIPIFGDIADFAYKANSKNLKILEDHLSQNFGEIRII